MNKEYKIKGRILGKDEKPLENIKIKAYDEKGVFLASALTDKEGNIDFECGSEPKFIKAANRGKILAEKDLIISAGISKDFGDWIICLSHPADWHIKGIVKDKMSGDPLQGLTVEIWDVDQGATVTYHDPLGLGSPPNNTDITDAAGEFNIWFDKEVFERTATSFLENYPDVLIKVKNAQGVVIHETEIDWNVVGTPHDCPPYCTHKGKEYILEIDYVTAMINQVGPVPTTDINASGLATYEGINDRPFGGNTTISGKIWGAKVDKWKLYYANGFVDSADSRITGLGPNDATPAGFTQIVSGIDTDKIWDGPIETWNTGNLEGLHTVILVVWDENGNEYHDTQVVHLHNQAITPAAQISSPAPGSTLNKTDGTSIQVQGTAADGSSPDYDYFLSYDLLWAGCSQTELTGTGITYPPAGNNTPVVSGDLGTWDISGLSNGPYVLRLGVHDRTIVNDGAHRRNDWTWNTVDISE